jgi:RNA-dependent RNA polymerase
MSSYSDLPIQSGSSSRKRSIDLSETSLSDSAPTIAPIVRRTMGRPQTPTGMGPPPPPKQLLRSVTLPTLATSQRIYPTIVDEESVFRVSPAKIPGGASISTGLSRSNAPSRKMNSTPSSSRPQPSTSTSLPVLNHQAKTSLIDHETSVGTTSLLPGVLAPSIDRSHVSPSTSRPPLHRQADVQLAPGGYSTSTEPPPEPAALDLSFLDVVSGGDLPFYIVAHNCEVQKLMDARRICWGAQWNIALGVSNGLWGWSDVTASKLDLLQGSNVEAAWKVSSVIRSEAVPQVAPGSLEIW